MAQSPTANAPKMSQISGWNGLKSYTLVSLVVDEAPASNPHDAPTVHQDSTFFSFLARYNRATPLGFDTS